MEQLDREQQQVLSVRAGACWVIAGPGTGKTATLVAKTTALIQAGERPLVVTYTRGAAAEMKKRMGPLRDQACLSTCHALALRILGRLSALLPRPRRLLSATEKATLLRTVRKRCRSELTEVELEEHLARVKACGATTEEEHVLLQVYESEKGPGRMDFQDLLIDTTALLQHAPPWREVYQAMYTHLLVDEAQDLDPLQAAFLAQFLTPRTAVTLFLDPDQCIYTYAGASPERTLVLLTQGLPQHVIELCTNYRSSPSLVEASLRLVQKNGTNRTMLAVRQGHERPRFARVRDERAEARLVAESIRALLDMGVPPKEILCLVRANAYRTWLEIELAERRIPFFLVQASREWRPTYLEWALQPVTSLLSLAAGAETAESWEAALRPYVGSVQAKLLAAAADRHRAAQEMGQRVTLRWQAFGRDLAELSAKRALPPVLLGELAARMTKSHGRAIEWAIAALARFASLERFATHVRTLHALSSTPHDRRIRLSTVHRAKGTEGKIVFVLGLSEGFFPLADAEEAEERRVCYVAFSRARDFLLATSPRSVGGRRTPRSRFLREAGLQRLYFPSAEKIRSLIQRAVTPFPDPAGQDDRHHTLPGAAVMPRAQHVGVVPLHNDKPHHEVPGTEKVGHGSLGSSRYRTPRRRNS